MNQVGGSEIKELFEVNYGKIGESALKDKNSKDKKQLAIELEQAIEEGNVEELEEFWGYIKSRHTQLKEEMTEDEEEKLSKCIEQLKQERVFILSNGELEDYLPEGCNSIDEIIKLTTDENFQPWVDGLGGEGMTLIDIVSEVLSD